MKYFKILLVFIVFNLCACSNLKDEKKFEFYKIKSDNIKVFSGIVKNQKISNLSFQINGKITYLPYSQGDCFKKGTILAKIDSSLYEIVLAEESSKLNEAQIKFMQAKNYYNRMNILHSDGAVSDNDWEDAGFNVGVREKEVLIQRAKLNYIKRELNYKTIKAPYDGCVFEKYADIGEIAQNNKKIISIIGSKKSQIDVLIPSTSINKLKINDKVKVKRDNKTYFGIIKHISKSSINSGGYLVKIELDKLYFELKEGMSVYAEFENLNENEIFIPLEAIFNNNQIFIYNKKLKVLEIKNITLGEIKGENIRILNGLKNEDIILIKGVKYAKNKEKINNCNNIFDF